MQQLLTGRTRLPGFNGAWTRSQLAGIATIKGGATPSTAVASHWGGDVPWCTPTDITREPGKYLTQTARSLTPEGLANCSAELLPKGTLLLCSRATIGEVRIAGTAVCTNQGFKSLICSPGVSSEFLYYQLLTTKAKMLERATGSTFVEISGRDLGTLHVALPPVPEQQAIADVLSDMDSELESLQQRLAKTRAIKQGAMQQLLTGRIRLPLDRHGGRTDEDVDA